MGTRLALVVGTLLALGCSERTSRLDSDTPIVMVVIDTLRADRVGFDGYGRETTPALDALAEESIVFERAWSPAPWTLPAMVSTMTSTWPLDHGVVAAGQRIGPDQSPLAERLRRQGFRTAAFVANPLAATASGLDAGFERVERSRRTVSLEAIEGWLEEHQTEPFFLYVHTTEPHLPYAAPGRFFEQIGHPPPERRKGLVQRMYRYRSLTRRAGPEAEPAGTDVESRQRESLKVFRRRKGDLDLLYDASVAWADHNFGALVEALRRRGLLDRCLLVVFSDHGEEMLEHGGVLHGQSLYAELTRVPMLWRLPGGERGGSRVAESVSLVDVAPTLFDLVGRASGEPAFTGRSFADRLLGAGSAEAEAPAAVTSVRVERGYDYPTDPPRGDLNLAAVEGSWKAIWDADNDRLELYDLAADPAELHDRSADEPERAARLGAVLRSWLAARPSLATPPGEDGAPSVHQALDDEDLERLRALGYID